MPARESPVRALKNAVMSKNKRACDAQLRICVLQRSNILFDLHRQRYTSLTAADLAAIRDTTSSSVVALLWEAHRLHRAIRRIDQIGQMCVSEPAGAPHAIGEAFESELSIGRRGFAGVWATCGRLL